MPSVMTQPLSRLPDPAMIKRALLPVPDKKFPNILYRIINPRAMVFLSGGGEKCIPIVLFCTTFSLVCRVFFRYNT